MGASEEEIDEEIGEEFEDYMVCWTNRHAFQAWSRFRADLLPDGMTGRINYGPLMKWLDWEYPKSPKKKSKIFDECRAIAAGAVEARAEKK